MGYARKQTRRKFLKDTGKTLTAVGAGGLTSMALAQGSPGARPGGLPPNIIVFLVDDMGWTDSETYGSPLYESPALNRLASEGVKFSNAYSASPLCSATRACLMTGKYPHLLHLTGAIVLPVGGTEITDPIVRTTAASWARVTSPEFLTHLPLEEYTIAEALKAGGYTTAHIGKWHLGHETWYPENNGYDYNIAGGHYAGPPSYFSPYNIDTLANGPTGEYITDRLTTEAEDFIETHQNEPFFLSFWHYAVHGPWQAKDSLISKYDALADPDSQHRDPTYAGMLESMDQSLGRILDKLDALNLANDTVVLFVSDNGGLNATNGAAIEYISSNAPLRGGKAMIYEGGTRTPMVVRWPGTVTPATTSEAVVSSVDLYPTLLEIAGLSAQPGQILDGESLVPVFSGSGSLSRDAIYCHFPHYIFDATPPGELTTDYYWNTPSTYMRQGDWKLIRFYGEGETNTEDRYELYNLASDPGETTDLVTLYPARVSEMAAVMVQHLSDTGALIPLPNPLYAPSTYNDWRVGNNVTLTLEGGILKMQATGTDPYIVGPSVAHTAPVQIQVRYRTTQSTAGQVYWTSQQQPGFVGHFENFTMITDGDWHTHTYDVPIDPGDVLTQFRLDSTSGLVEVDWMRVVDVSGSEPVTLESWDFEDDPVVLNGWQSLQQCTISQIAGAMRVDLEAGDPILLGPPRARFGPLRAKLRMRIQSEGQGQHFWAEGSAYTFAGHSATFDLIHDGQWHEYTIELPVPNDQQLIQLRLDPGNGAGWAEIDYIRLFRPATLGDQLVDTWDFGQEQVAAAQTKGNWAEDWI